MPLGDQRFGRKGQSRPVRFIVKKPGPDREIRSLLSQDQRPARRAIFRRGLDFEWLVCSLSFFFTKQEGAAANEAKS
jgi:hypothetical protein